MQLKQQVSDLTAVVSKIAHTDNTVDEMQTPMMKSIAILLTLIQHDHDVMYFNNVMNAKSMD